MNVVPPSLEARLRGGKPVTRRRQIVGVLVIFALLGGALGITVLLTQHLGAELGESCVQGAFACKNAGFNDARCLMSGEHGVCTRLCDDATPCPKGWRCDHAVWVRRGQRDDGRGRVERMCMKP